MSGIISIGSYITVGQEFEDHWKLSEGAVGVGIITLKGGYKLPAFQADFATVTRSITGIAGQILNLGILRGQLEAAKTALRDRMRQFRGIALAQTMGTPFEVQVPTLPKAETVQSKFMEPIDAGMGLWERVSEPVAQGGLGLIIVLPGDYDADTFRDAIAALNALYASESSATKSLENALKQRDAVLETFHERLKQYRQGIVGFLPQNDPLLLSVPRLSPRAGTTPKPVTELAGGWDAALGKARVTWTPSLDPKVTHLSARICLGTKWKEDEEVVLGPIALGVTSYEFVQGLETPGSVICLKIFAIGEDDNESGGKAIVLTRPVV